jgi:hypothetical protein
MLLGDVLRNLQDEMLAMESLVAMNDFVLLTRVQNAAGLLGETPGEYAVNSVCGFANLAGDDDWLALLTAIEDSGDAGQTCLVRMIGWALQRDAAPHTHRGCICGGHSS